MDPVVVIGSGLAGYNAAREFRRLDKQTPLLVVTADSGEFYSKPMLSNALAAGKTPEAIPLSSAGQMAAQLAAAVRTRARVSALDTTRREVIIDGESIRYSKLVLALGAGQIRVPLAGDAADTVMTVNSLDDYARLRAAIQDKRRIAIVGAGLIGCEFANDLAANGYQVDVIDVAAQPLPRLLPPAGAEMLRRSLAGLGVTWHLGTTVASVERAADGLHVTLANGDTIQADAVLSAVGLKPETGLARAAGLAVSRGIQVNRMLQTSAPQVYALGDC
ncbi:MAG: FAD-dependent oxidoreductase, partial [Betaproteobacteria bacterium]|nr:FAD-dependent oxidoreductase [Betaproteobacteria bacterium]